MSAPGFDPTMREFPAPVNLNDDITLFDMSGYTIVGDGTTAQLSGILSGILETDREESKSQSLKVLNIF
jgi:hypothetical protein